MCEAPIPQRSEDQLASPASDALIREYISETGMIYRFRIDGCTMTLIEVEHPNITATDVLERMREPLRTERE